MHITITWSTKAWNKDAVTEAAKYIHSVDLAFGEPVIVEEEGKQRVLVTIPYYRSKASANTIILISEFSAVYGPGILDQQPAPKALPDIQNESTGEAIVPKRDVLPRRSGNLMDRLKSLFAKPE